MNLNKAGLLIAVLLSSLSSSTFAGDDTKNVVLQCEKRIIPGISKTNRLEYAHALIINAMKDKSAFMPALYAMGQIDTLLTSSYGLRKPLASITDTRGVKAISRMSQLIMGSYVVAAQMTLGVIEKEEIIPQETLVITGNMVYTLNEPDDVDPILGEILEKVQKADLGIALISPDSLPYAKWALRGYAYNDSVAVDAAMAGFCMSNPTARDGEYLVKWAKKIRYIDKAKR